MGVCTLDQHSTAKTSPFVCLFENVTLKNTLFREKVTLKNTLFWFEQHSGIIVSVTRKIPFCSYNRLLTKVASV